MSDNPFGSVPEQWQRLTEDLRRVAREGSPAEIRGHAEGLEEDASTLDRLGVRVDAQVLANRFAMPGETPRNHLTEASSDLWHTVGVGPARTARAQAQLLWLAADILEGAA
jgi:hypothetical protein